MKRSTRCLIRVAMLVGLALSIDGSVQAEQAVAAESSEATIYVLRPSSFEPTTRIWTFADERFLGATRGGSYTVARLAEGRHLIWSKSENIASLEIEIKAAEALYILQAALPGERKARVKLTLLSETRGRRILESCEYRPLREKERARGEAVAAKNASSTDSPIMRMISSTSPALITMGGES